jgi:tetratricopeptide (TPR) repeat protein
VTLNVPWFWITVVGVLFVLTKFILRAVRGSPHPRVAVQDQPFAGGRSGEAVVSIPRSSALLNADLLRAAECQMQASQSAEVRTILGLVTARRYETAIGKIDKLLHTSIHEDVKVMLLWVKSNVYQRTGESESEVELLKELCAIRANCIFEMNAGTACSRLEKYSEAETHFLGALSLSRGNYPLAHYNLGILYCRALRKQEAMSELYALEDSGEDVPLGLKEKLKLRISEIPSGGFV